MNHPMPEPDAALRAAMAITESPLPMGWSPEEMAAIIRREYAGLVEAAKGLAVAVQALHGEPGWDIYRQHAPEMKAWVAALKDAGAK